MGTRRVTYIASLIGSALFYVLYSHWFSWYLLTLLLLLIPLDLLLSLPGMLTRRIILVGPDILEQGADGVVSVITLQKEPLPTKLPIPARCIKAWMRVHCDDFAAMQRHILGAERGSRHELEIDTSHSGLTTFELKRIWTVSLIGLFSLPAAVNGRKTVLVMPAPAKPPNTVALPRGVILRPKPGGGFSEDYDLRHYRPGDPVRSIHWKISAKFDSIIIREPLIPPSHSRIIIVDRWDDRKGRDLVLGRLRWVSDYLLKWELPYFIRLGADGPIAEIDGAGALTDYLRRVLDGQSHTLKAPASVPARFTWAFHIDARSTV